MAKSTKPSGVSRIKLIVLEAEVADDQLHTLTQAFTNALRGPSTTVKRLAPTPATNGHAEPEEEILDGAEDDADTVDVTPSARTAPRKKRVGAKPNMIPIDVDTEPKLSSLVDGKSNHKRYLTIAAWLHDHRDTPIITQDHIFSCYRLLGWPIDIADFGQPFRELKHKQYFESPERGKYAINQLGLQKAKEAE
jgi:hypothetical protein